MKLVEVGLGHPSFQDTRDRHYVPNHGVIGRGCNYLIFEDGTQLFEQPIGIISGSSAVWASPSRDQYFGINKDNRVERINSIINNNVFRLEKNVPNLASKILSLWRKIVVKDWIRKYGGSVIGFETFVYGDGRNGTCYKADNWTFTGHTKGEARFTTSEHGKIVTYRIPCEKKLVFCKRLN